MRECLAAALEALPESQRVVFVLNDLEGWSAEAIAEELEQAPAALRRSLHLARVRIHACLASHGFHRGLRASSGVARSLLSPRRQPPPPEALEALEEALRRIQGRPS